MIEHENQIMQIVYYNFKKKKATTSSFSEFLNLAKEYLLKHGYGLYMHDYQREIYFVKPVDSVENKLKVIEDYIDSLTNPSREDFLKYENLDLYCENKRKELVWIIKYSNPILQNRKEIYNSMFNSHIMWKYQFADVPEEIYDLGFKILIKKYGNKFDSEYTDYLNKFKKWNLFQSMKNDKSEQFYNFIQNLLNLKTSY